MTRSWAPVSSTQLAPNERLCSYRPYIGSPSTGGRRGPRAAAPPRAPPPQPPPVPRRIAPPRLEEQVVEPVQGGVRVLRGPREALAELALCPAGPVIPNDDGAGLLGGP